jgi:hypothetical protein
MMRSRRETASCSTRRGCWNDDGGFGHALEPGVRCPSSLPIDVEMAFQALAAAGAGGAVPPAFPVIEAFPRAAHWTEWTYEPGLNPTAGLLYQLGVDHPWRSAGTAYCWQQLESGGLRGDAHALKEVLLFLEHVPDRPRADQHAAVLAPDLAGIPLFHLDPDTPGYGLSPLDIAPRASSRWRALFTHAQLSAHLDRRQKDQQDDGGWPVTGEPPSPAAVSEWRGIVTLGALRTLTSYGRLKTDRRRGPAQA